MWIYLLLYLTVPSAIGFLLGISTGSVWRWLRGGRREALLPAPKKAEIEAELRTLLYAEMSDRELRKAFRQVLQEHNLMIVRRRFPYLYCCTHFEVLDGFAWVTAGFVLLPLILGFLCGMLAVGSGFIFFAKLDLSPERGAV